MAAIFGQIFGHFSRHQSLQVQLKLQSQTRGRRDGAEGGEGWNDSSEAHTGESFSLAPCDLIVRKGKKNSARPAPASATQNVA